MALLKTTDRIFVAGHRGLVGSHLCDELKTQGFKHLLCRTRQELDLLDATAVRAFFESERPNVVFLAAAKVGGILANDTFRADFIAENLAIQTNVLQAAKAAGAHRFIFLGSSCIYPRACRQPMRESDLLSGPLEITNRSYAIAKIAGLELVDALRRQHGLDYFSVMPTNLYGPGDNYHPENSHVLPALIRRFHEAKDAGASKVDVWGSGKPKREFMHAKDCARAIVHLAKTLTKDALDESAIGKAGWSHVNVGSGQEVTIRDLATLVADVIGFQGSIEWNSDRPDGTPRKLLDTAFLQSTGFEPQISLKAGIEDAYAAFLKEAEVSRVARR